MRILIISRYFPPYESIASLRPYSWAKYWSRQGHQVSVLTWDGGETRRYSLNIGGTDVEVINVENRVYSTLDKLFKKVHSSNDSAVDIVKSEESRSLLSLIAHKIMDRQHDCRMPHVHDFWCRSALAEIKDESWDLAVSTYAPPVTHAIACKLKKSGAVSHWIADFRDLWTEHTIAKGFFPFTVWEAFLERRYVALADVVTTVSEPLAETLRCKYLTSKVKVITNGFDKDDLAGLPKENIFVDEKVRLVYTGTLYKDKQDPGALFEAVAKISRDTIHQELLSRLELVFVGGNTASLEKMARAYGVQQWVSCQGHIPRCDALRMQRDAHVLIFLDWGDPEVMGVLTGKLFEYLRTGKTIWGIGGAGSTELSSAGELIRDAAVGKMFGHDSDAIRVDLIHLLEKQKPQSVAPRMEVLQRYDRESLAVKMLGLVSLDKV